MKYNNNKLIQNVKKPSCVCFVFHIHIGKKTIYI